MAISDKLKNMVSNWNQSEVPSEFGDISYYGLLRNTLKIVQQLILDWESASGEFDSQIAEAKLLVEQLKGDYLTFVNDVNSTIDSYKSDTDSKINANNQLVNQLQTNVDTFYANITASVNGLSNDFNDLKTYVENYLGSEDFLQAMADEIGRQINDNPDFAELVRQAIESLKPIHFADVGITEPNDKTAFDNAVKTVALPLSGGTMTGTILLNNNVDIRGLETTGKSSHIARLGDDNKIYLGSTILPLQINSSTKPTWFNDSTGKFLALEEDVVSKLPLSGGTMSGTLGLANNVGLQSATTTGEKYYIFRLNLLNVVGVGSVDLPTQIYSNVQPMWNNGTQIKTLALQEDVTSKMPISGGTFTGTVALSNGIALYGKDTTNANIPIGGVNNYNQIMIGGVSNPLYLRSNVRPKVLVNSVEQQLAYLSDVTGGSGDYLPLSGGTMSNNSRIKFPDSNNNSNFYVGYDGISMECNNNAPDFYIKNMGNGQVRNMVRSIQNSTSDYEVTNIYGDSNAPTQIESYDRPVVITNGSSTEHQIAYLSDIQGGGGGGVAQQVIGKEFTIQAEGQTSQVVSFTADEFTDFNITDYDLSNYEIDLFATYTVDSATTNEKIDFKYSSTSNGSNNVKLYGTGYFRVSLGKNVFSFEIFKNSNFTTAEFNGTLYMRLLKVG